MKKQPTFNELADRHIREGIKVSLETDEVHIKQLRPVIGDTPYDRIYRGYDGKGTPTKLENFLLKRAEKGLSLRTLNGAVEIINLIGNLASTQWRLRGGELVLPFYNRVHKISKRQAKALTIKPPTQHPPMSWEEQTILFNEFSDRLRDLALFAVNTGLREKEICHLRWEWEQFDPESGIRFFMIPREEQKNWEHRIVILNSVAESIVLKNRGIHSRYVFSYNGERFEKINSTSFKRARIRAAKKRGDVRKICVHSFRVTFSTRLRAALVPEEDRKELMGHVSNRSMTAHYSLPDLSRLKAYVDRITKPTINTITLKRRAVR
ncbi:tyrosine-type recombinase/integrase [Candidatus Pacearchaeota archaeon]|nr:tyrosine-type recombinase/integrase [Candidatus Pacearchaeota archaeon]